jgi:hypothetical protein
MRLRDIIYHTTYRMDTRALYKTLLEILLIELGMGKDLSSISYAASSHLVTKSLIKSTWKFLDEHSIHLKHDITVDKQ